MLQTVAADTSGMKRTQKRRFRHDRRHHVCTAAAHTEHQPHLKGPQAEVAAMVKV